LPLTFVLFFYRNLFIYLFNYFKDRVYTS